jgi:hypothetical protein
VRHPPSYVPLVTRIVAVIDVLPEDVHVAPVIPPPPLDEDELVLELEVELELVELVELLVLELDEPVFEYEQYRGLSTLIDGNSEPEQVIGPVSVAYTNVPDLPYATDRVPVNEQVAPSLAHLVYPEG